MNAAMNTLTIAWIALPFFVGFVIYLFPRLDRWLAVSMAIASTAFSLLLFHINAPQTLYLLDNFGVKLIVDPLSGFFILTNGLLTLAIALYCWNSNRTAFFYAQMTILHGSVNAAFACADFVSLYVALEVTGIAAFLLIAYPRTDRSIWVGLRYLFISNTAMLFYLVGAVLVYQAHHSFEFAGLQGAPPEAQALIFLGLLTKGGIFVSGLWLPLTHGESESPVSALLSGAVVKAGVFPLVRCALVLDEIDPLVRIFGAATALLGVLYAIFEKDTKRMLAFHTVSQLGFVLAAPEVGGFYALAHGLVKAALFLIAGILPSRNFKDLQQQPIHTPIWIALVLASFSISGFPLLSGFGAKVLTMKNLVPWQVIAMNLAALGTAISFAKFIFLPHANLPPANFSVQAEAGSETGSLTVSPTKSLTHWGFWAAIVILIGGLVVANIVYYDAYTLENIIKPLATIFLGWLAYLLVFRRTIVKLPRVTEKFEHLVGGMSLMLILLFWMAIAS